MLTGYLDFARQSSVNNSADKQNSFGCRSRWNDDSIGVFISSSERIIETPSYVMAFTGFVDNVEELAAGTGINAPDLSRLLSDVLERFAPKGFLERVSGSMAAAIWDKRNRALTLAIDRIGLEVLAYGIFGDFLVFSSDIGKLEEHPAFRGDIDMAALGAYFRHNYIPSPHTVYRGVRKLLPGEYLEASSGRGESVRRARYWDPASRMASAMENRFTGTFEDAVDELDVILGDAVRRRLPDGSGGAFLSGGIDSALMAAIACKVAGGVDTFTVGYDEENFNEASHARVVAEHLGTIHHELRVTPDMAMELIPELSSIYPEPFADSSQIPTTLVSLFAKERRGIVLSGDGGDETFGGYGNYLITENLWRKVAGVPSLVRGIAGAGASVLAFTGIAGKRNTLRAAKIKEILKLDSIEGVHRVVTSLAEPSADVIPQGEAPTIFTDSSRWAASGEPKERLMFADYNMYLPDDGVVKVRQAARHAELDVRSPILDHRVAEFAWSLPMEYKIAGKTGKAVLKELLYRYVPRELLDRPKHGFSMPLEIWLQGPLAGWADGLWQDAGTRVDEVLGNGYTERLRKHYGRIHTEARWGVLRLLDWIERH